LIFIHISFHSLHCTHIFLSQSHSSEHLLIIHLIYPLIQTTSLQPSLVFIVKASYWCDVFVLLIFVRKHIPWPVCLKYHSRSLQLFNYHLYLQMWRSRFNKHGGCYGTLSPIHVRPVSHCNIIATSHTVHIYFYQCKSASVSSPLSHDSATGRSTAVIVEQASASAVQVR
jgi:hypothetical protein